MKKAKMMLTGIAVLAVVGAGLAFKANRSTKVIYCTDSATADKCDLISYTSSTIVNEANLPQSYCTFRAFSQSPCALTSTKQVVD